MERKVTWIKDGDCLQLENGYNGRRDEEKKSRIVGLIPRKTGRALQFIRGDFVLAAIVVSAYEYACMLQWMTKDQLKCV